MISRKCCQSRLTQIEWVNLMSITNKGLRQVINLALTLLVAKVDH